MFQKSKGTVVKSLMFTLLNALQALWRDLLEDFFNRKIQYFVAGKLKYD